MDTIFEYLEYRDFLKDYYERNKSKGSFFSFRYFGNKTGIDASFLVKVMQKQMHISNKTVPRLIEFFKFNEKESEYFETLVSYNKAKNQNEIKLYFEKLLSFRSPFVKTLVAEQYEFFKEWYNIALYELLTFHPYKGTIKELALKLNPPIAVQEARSAVKLLKKLNLITKDLDGSLKVINKLVTTGEKWESIAIRNFQKKMIQLSEEAIDRFPKERRDISTVTISLSREQVDIMKDRIRAMRKELLEMADREVKAEEVYQVNFQVFPLSDIQEEGR